MENIIVRCKDSCLDSDIVTDKTFLDIGLSIEELDALKKEGLKNGFFKYDDNYFEVRKKEKKRIIEGKINLPEAQNGEGRKVKYLIENVVNLTERVNNHKVKMFYTIFGEKLEKAEFHRRVGISDSFLRKNASNCSSFDINGVHVEITWEQKAMRFYTLKNLKTGFEKSGLRACDITKRIKCPMSKIRQTRSTNPYSYYKDYIIEREA